MCKEADKYELYSVCIQTFWVQTAAEQLKESDTLVSTVIGFLQGANTKEVKAFEAKQAVENGAHEVDMVINVGALKSGKDEIVVEEIQAVYDAIEGKALLKVIVENGELTEDEKRRVYKIVKNSPTDFIKTSTGFASGGATLEDVRLMKSIVGDGTQIKASGGVRSYKDALEYIEAGANRIGASSGVKIVEESKEK